MIDKVILHEGETFYSRSGLPFTYKIYNKSLKIVRDGKEINRIVSFNEIQKAIDLQPQKITDICYKVQAGAYIYALMFDERMQ